MKRTIDSERAADLLNNGYLPFSKLTANESLHDRLVFLLRDLLIEVAKEVGLEGLDDVGELYEPFQEDHSLRVELLSWKMLMNNLPERLSAFLRNHAPNHAITLTFDFDDDPVRELESPILTIFPNEIVACFEDCDLPDTPVLLGFT